MTHSRCNQIFTSAIILSISFLFIPAWGETLHVPADYETTQSAIDESVTGDVVLVAEGEYYENIDFKGKAITVASHYYLEPEEKYIFITVINGCEPQQPEKASVVSFVSGEQNNSILLGFTITEGRGTFWEERASRLGGGILCYQSQPQILHNRIIANSLATDYEANGAGIACISDKYLSKAKPVIIKDNIIEKNSCSGSSGAYGGGLYIQVPAVIENNTVLSNTAFSQNFEAFGGGVCYSRGYAETVLVEMRENTIKYNGTKTVGENQSAFGGGIAVCDGLLEMKDNIIERNYLVSLHHNFGGGAYLYHLQDNSLILNNQFNGNMTLDEESETVMECFGGGLLLMKSNSVIIENNCFRDNMATRGGALGSFDSEIFLRNNILTHNQAYHNGGALYLVNRDIEQQEPSYADGFDNFRNSSQYAQKLFADDELEKVPASSRNPESHLTNNTFTGNIADFGGAIYSLNANPVVLNSILWGDRALQGGPEFFIASGKITINYSNVEQNLPDNPFYFGNMQTDPGFLAGQACCLCEDSPCIDAGHPDEEYCDPEDPKKPGFALLPALGTIRNDMGAYGGPCACQWIKEEGLENFASKGNSSKTIPEGFALYQNYPNPFNPRTTIKFNLPKDSQVTLKIYNIIGEEVATLISASLLSGSYEYQWDASQMASGMYIYRLETVSGFVQMRKMILMK